MRVSPRAAPCRAYYLFLWLCFCVFVVPFFFIDYCRPGGSPALRGWQGGVRAAAAVCVDHSCVHPPLFFYPLRRTTRTGAGGTARPERPSRG